MGYGCIRISFEENMQMKVQETDCQYSALKSLGFGIQVKI